MSIIPHSTEERVLVYCRESPPAPSVCHGHVQPRPALETMLLLPIPCGMEDLGHSNQGDSGDR